MGRSGGGGGDGDDGDDGDNDDDYDIIISDDEDDSQNGNLPAGMEPEDVIFDLTQDAETPVIEIPNASKINPRRVDAWTELPKANNETNNNKNATNPANNRLFGLDPANEDEQADAELGENLLNDDGGLLMHPEIPEEGTEPHECVTTKLQKHQKQALLWMIQRERTSYRGCRGGMLLDDPGLGKTLSMLSLIVTHALQKEHPKTRELHPAPTLVVAPTHLIQVWRQEAVRHTRPGFLDVAVYHGPRRRTEISIERMRDMTSNHHIVLTSYGVVKSEFEVIREEVNGKRSIKYRWKRGSIFDRLWARVILDEAHIIRNYMAATSRAVMNLQADFTWVVTATPVHNRLNDLYPLFNFLNIYTDFPSWKWSVLNVIKQNPINGFAQLQSLMQKIGMRRPKAIMNLPLREEKRIKLSFSQAEKSFYDALFAYSQERVQHFLRRITAMQRLLAQMEGEGIGNVIVQRIQRARLCILVLLLRLRQACCHPQLVIGAMRRLSDTLTRVEHDDEEHGYERDGFFDRVLREAAKTLSHFTQQARGGQVLEDECSICMDDTAEFVARPCGHKYCSRCYDQVRLDRRRGVSACATCRRDVRTFEKANQPPNNNNNNNPNVSPKKRTTLEGLDSDDECVGEVKEKEVVDDNEKIDIKEEDPTEMHIPEHLFFGSSTKLQTLANMIRADIAKGDKVVVVSQWLSLLDIIATYLSELRPIINVNRIDGRTLAMKRHHLVLGFQNDPSIQVCLLSLLAGAEGITLTTSRKLYHVDPWWNPAKATQASDRVHRIGQERDVEIVHLHMANTIEDSIHELQEKKKAVASAVMGEGKVTQDMTWANEIKLLFGLLPGREGGVELPVDDLMDMTFTFDSPSTTTTTTTSSSSSSSQSSTSSRAGR